MNEITNDAVMIRPLQYGDLDQVAQLGQLISGQKTQPNLIDHLPTFDIAQELSHIRRWFWPLKIVGAIIPPYQYVCQAYVAEIAGEVHGVMQIAPVNRTNSTFRVERVLVDAVGKSHGLDTKLLRYGFEKIWQARTWVLEVNVNDKEGLSLYRQNGFQPLAQMTYWAIAPEILQNIAQSQPDLPNLLPVSNADAQLLYQLDTVSMPPILRQVFDRHILDFKTGLVSALIEGVRQWFNRTEKVSGYVFETQRKAAIGYFQMELSREGNQPHIAHLTVHPAYTWLYPELLAQMARISQDYPAQTLHLASADYQPEREAYLEQIGATRIEHTLLMSRSVWHKLRESRSVDIQLKEVLQGFQPVRKPVPSRSSWLKFVQKSGEHSQFPPAENLSDVASSQPFSFLPIIPPNNTHEEDRERPENQHG
jgi:ribosomal protein S18 acetylase RimI-like enzyme